LAAASGGRRPNARSGRRILQLRRGPGLPRPSKFRVAFGLTTPPGVRARSTSAMEGGGGFGLSRLRHWDARGPGLAGPPGPRGRRGRIEPERARAVVPTRAPSRSRCPPPGRAPRQGPGWAQAGTAPGPAGAAAPAAGPPPGSSAVGSPTGTRLPRLADSSPTDVRLGLGVRGPRPRRAPLACLRFNSLSAHGYAPGLSCQ
jgi:hypothetical protein